MLAVKIGSFTQYSSKWLFSAIHEEFYLIALIQVLVVCSTRCSQPFSITEIVN